MTHRRWATAEGRPCFFVRQLYIPADQESFVGTDLRVRPLFVLQYMKSNWGLLLLLVFALLLAGCGPTPPATLPTVQDAPSPSPNLPTASPTVLAAPRMAEAAATLTVAPTEALGTPLPLTIPVLKPEPVVLAPDVRTPSWSPDGKWISYWIPYQEVTDPDYIPINVKPAYYEVATGRTCTYDEFGASMQPEFAAVYSYWQEDGRPVIVSNGGHIADAPCGDFTPLSHTALPGWDYALSTDGRYRAETVYETDKNVATTFISEVQTGEPVDSIVWEHRGGQIAGVAGRWLSNRHLLIYSTLQGPLLYTVGGDTVEVFLTIFHISPSLQNGVWAAPDLTTGHFHMILSSADNTAPLSLYHSETGKVEILPFTGGWTANGQTFFSPDGHWLLLQLPTSAPEGVRNYEEEWIRPVDGSEADTKLFAQAGNGMHLSPDGSLVAAQSSNQGASVLILTFPAGEGIQQWSVDGYLIYPVGWSPDGTRLLMQGYLIDSNPLNYDPQDVGLFLATIQP
jgi:WD40 repeat protein